MKSTKSPACSSSPGGCLRVVVDPQDFDPTLEHFGAEATW